MTINSIAKGLKVLNQVPGLSLCQGPKEERSLILSLRSMPKQKAVKRKR